MHLKAYERCTAYTAIEVACLVDAFGPRRALTDRGGIDVAGKLAV